MTLRDYDLEALTLGESMTLKCNDLGRVYNLELLILREYMTLGRVYDL